MFRVVIKDFKYSSKEIRQYGLYVGKVIRSCLKFYLKIGRYQIYLNYLFILFMFIELRKVYVKS